MQQNVRIEGIAKAYYGKAEYDWVIILTNNLINPQPGLLVMFPSWLQHVVYPFEGAGERRTIAGNLNVFAMPD